MFWYKIFERNSFLIKNRLTFYRLNSSENNFKHLIDLIYEITYEKLDRNNLSPDLFRNVQYISVVGVLDGMEFVLFKDFVKLKVFTLAISNFKELFHMGNQSMKSLNSN